MGLLGFVDQSGERLRIPVFEARGGCGHPYFHRCRNVVIAATNICAFTNSLGISYPLLMPEMFY
jgi:hypothetical protein